MKDFKTLYDKKSVDIINYIKDYLSSHKDIEILIGCDSQVKGRETVYALVLAMYTPGKGAHVLYDRFSTPKDREISTRLMNEVWHSINLADELMNAGLPRAKYIDIDLNPDPRYKSNEVLRAAVGWAEGLGYSVRHKGDSPMMTYCADLLVKS
jgi:predicted RNase H-related nuclease YkuK (DUF458 family)